MLADKEVAYEMKYIKEFIERSISQYSEENFNDKWCSGIENSVLFMVRNDSEEFKKNFNINQRTVMKSLVHRGYWVRRIEGWVTLVELPGVSQDDRPAVDSKKPKIYIAGPMTGLANGNRDIFNAKESQLVSEGWIVINPARMDSESGINPDAMGEYDYEDCARRDIEVLVNCDAIYMLAGFQFSKGACWERALAKHLGIKRYYEVPRADHEAERLFQVY